jgi:phage terminase small subunit
MAREMNENQKKAKELYDKGYKLIDISKELDTAESTIRVWKNRFKWDNTKCNVSNNKNSINNEKSSIIKDLTDNDELSPEHKMFCVIYAKRQNATKAYQMVYHYTYEVAMINGHRLLRNAKIKEQINLLLEEELNKELSAKTYISKGLSNIETLKYTLF